MDKAANLREFFADAVNSVTRERIFFNRLSFDLKIAAARVRYHLHLYEPDVDRDGFDIVAEDPDRVRWYQTKAVLSDAGTTTWDISVDFLRPAVSYAHDYGFDPVVAGRGGGVILIEIDQTSDTHVTYSYTDFDILAAIAEGFVVERAYKGRGRPATPARQEAGEIITALRTTERRKKVSVSKKLFVRIASADDLLGVMGLQSEKGYGMYSVRDAYRRITVELDGRSGEDAPIDIAPILHHNMRLLCDAQPKSDTETKVTVFDPFEWVRTVHPPS